MAFVEVSVEREHQRADPGGDDRQVGRPQRALHAVHHSGLFEVPPDVEQVVGPVHKQVVAAHQLHGREGGALLGQRSGLGVHLVTGCHREEVQLREANPQELAARPVDRSLHGHVRVLPHQRQ